MDTCTHKIRELSLKLLEEKEVDKVIGFANGTIPMEQVPLLLHQNKIHKNLFSIQHAD